MNNLATKLFIMAVAIGLSFLSYKLINGWYNIIPWAIAALLIGYFSNKRRDAIINGAIFGYVLFLVYIILGYGGKTGPASIIKFIAFNLLFSLVGAIAGAIDAFIGFLLRRKIVGK